MNTPIIALKNSVVEKKCEMVTKEKIWMIFTWIIPDYSKLESKIFYIRKATTTSREWMFRLLKSAPFLYLILEPTDKRFVNFTILGKNVKPLNDGVGSLLTGEQCFAEIDISMLSEKSGYLENDCLTVQCKYLDKTMDRKIDTYDYDVFQKNLEICTLRADLKQMYTESICSDFKLRVGSKEFNVHKAILATRCDFFKEMFSLLSPRRNDVEMTYKAKPEIFQEILDYIYADEFRVSTMDAMLNVLEIAIDLKLVELRDRCREAISKNINEDNIKHVFSTALIRDHKELKNECAHLISKKYPGVLTGDMFKSILRMVKK